nr:hypothetical protein Iba_chr04fCG14320 [Ipomoea batatas]
MDGKLKSQASASRADEAVRGKQRPHLGDSIALVIDEDLVANFEIYIPCNRGSELNVKMGLMKKTIGNDKNALQFHSGLTLIWTVD